MQPTKPTQFRAMSRLVLVDAFYYYYYYYYYYQLIMNEYQYGQANTRILALNPVMNESSIKLTVRLRHRTFLLLSEGPQAAQIGGQGSCECLGTASPFHAGEPTSSCTA